MVAGALAPLRAVVVAVVADAGEEGEASRKPTLPLKTTVQSRQTNSPLRTQRQAQVLEVRVTPVAATLGTNLGAAPTVLPPVTIDPRTSPP
jgi:hypothetical protein